MDYSVICSKAKKKTASQVAPPNQGPPEKPDAPPSHGPSEKAPPPLSQGPALPKGGYELYMGGPSTHCDPIWRNRHVNNAELTHSRTYRVNFWDQDPYFYEYSSMHCGPPLPPPELQPYRHVLPPPRPPNCHMHSVPRSISPPKYILPAALPPPPPPPPSQCLAAPPGGPPLAGYHSYGGWFSDENPNGCIIM